MIRKCQQCNKEYEAERKSSKFCGNACRQANSRIVKKELKQTIKDSVTRDLEDIAEVMNNKEADFLKKKIIWETKPAETPDKI